MQLLPQSSGHAEHAEHVVRALCPVIGPSGRVLVSPGLGAGCPQPRSGQPQCSVPAEGRVEGRSAITSPHVTWAGARSWEHRKRVSTTGTSSSWWV